MTFAELGLRSELLSALESAGYTVPTPVQEQAIPVILAGKDILAGAQTGTGKTAGFALPLLQRLMPVSGKSPAALNRAKGARYSARKPVRALILAPTRELAAQVEASVALYGKFLPLTSTCVFGGVGIGPQMKALARGVDVLVATPGRLLDHVHQGTVDLSSVETFILDEADRMLDMGFINDIRKIVALIPRERQTLLFSATFSNEIKALADGLLHEPVHVEVARQNAESDLVDQVVYGVTTERKRDLLVHLLQQDTIQQALIFTRTKHTADRLAKHLHLNGIPAAVIHGNRSQSQRTNALAEFKAGTARIMVATDIAARGLDIRELPHVINYEIPNLPEDYIHRIGRTGRAGKSGQAISLVSGDERKFLTAIERLLKKTLERREVAGFESPLFDANTPESRSPMARSGRPPQRDGARRFGRPSQSSGRAPSNRMAR